MPAFLDYKDSKILIIWFLGIIIGLCGTLYAKDQSRIESDQIKLSSLISKNKENSTKEAVKDKDEIIALITKTSEYQKRSMDRHYYFLRDEVVKIQKDGKEVKLEQKKMAIDIAILKSKQK